ncbi:hypothetical protein [Anaerotruncus sp. DFI.9.16]|nr:hypothetical protein [Anaerotruncus sp. DFI.9.16]MCQ4897391.1 hypothetical protein [Anaerotruncus sp. DFI.9.16]
MFAVRKTKGYNGFNQMVSLYADGERTTYAYRPDGLRKHMRCLY